MRRCPITYEECEGGKYSLKGLKKLSPKMTSLKDFPLSAEEQVREAISRAAKMSIQGVQPKLSVRLNLKNEIFEIVDTGGRYIFKPQTKNYREVPENEDVTMRLAKLIGIDAPLHGLVYPKDDTMTYFIQRFDRVGRNKKIPVEDFAQLSGKDRATKYDSSMEQIISLSLAEGEKVGKIKMILDEKEKPLGVQILGPQAGELLNEWVAVLNGKVKLSTLASAVHPYPTLGEINKRVAGAFFSPKIFSDKVKKGLKFFFHLKGRACELQE